MVLLESHDIETIAQRSCEASYIHRQVYLGANKEKSKKILINLNHINTTDHIYAKYN